MRTEQINTLPLRLRPHVDNLVNTLQWYRHKNECTPASPWTAKQICEKWNMSNETLHLTDVDIRALVNEARRQGNPIASTAKGYFYAVSIKELQPTIKDLLGREQAIKAARIGLEGSLK